MARSDTPAVIEVAISAVQPGAIVQSAAALVDEASACIQAGAGIVHHHHDARLTETDAVDELIAIGLGIQERHPSALVYTDYMPGRRAWEENAHLGPMAAAGALTMFSIDPGVTSFANLDGDGVPNGTYIDGLQFDDAHDMIEFSKELQVPVSLGVFDPSHLRWILAYELHVGFYPGTIIKLNFSGAFAVDRIDTTTIGFGMPPTTAALDVYLSMLHDSSLPWMVSLLGDSVLHKRLARHTLERGGHLRVGVEDAAGRSDRTNVEMVTAAVAMAAELGRAPVTGADTLAVLRG
jgi:3-keto-5-aminohexanoate cleavage enzyme